MVENELVINGEKDSLLQRCNDAFKNPKSKKAASALPTFRKDAAIPPPEKQNNKAFEDLPCTPGKKVFLTIDRLDCVQESDLGDFIAHPQALISRNGLLLHFHMSC